MGECLSAWAGSEGGVHSEYVSFLPGMGNKTAVSILTLSRSGENFGLSYFSKLTVSKCRGYKNVFVSPGKCELCRLLAGVKLKTMCRFSRTGTTVELTRSPGHAEYPTGYPGEVSTRASNRPPTILGPRFTVKE